MVVVSLVVFVAVRSRVDHHVSTPPEHCPPDVHVHSLDLGVVAVIVVIIRGSGHRSHHVSVSLAQDVVPLGFHVFKHICWHVLD